MQAGDFVEILLPLDAGAHGDGGTNRIHDFGDGVLLALTITHVFEVVDFAVLFQGVGLQSVNAATKIQDTRTPLGLCNGSIIGRRADGFTFFAAVFEFVAESLQIVLSVHIALIGG